MLRTFQIQNRFYILIGKKTRQREPLHPIDSEMHFCFIKQIFEIVRLIMVALEYEIIALLMTVRFLVVRNPKLRSSEQRLCLEVKQLYILKALVMSYKVSTE